MRIGGVELCGSTKRKLNLLYGSTHKFHRLDKVNYSIPRLHTRSKRVPIEESLQAANNGVVHITRVLESECPKSQWHVVQLLYSSEEDCDALVANTWYPCKSKVNKGTHGNPMPTCIGMKKEFQSNNHIPCNFWFCSIDINWCVKGNKMKWVFNWPNIPSTWLVNVGTNFYWETIFALEATSPVTTMGGIVSTPSIGYYA